MSDHETDAENWTDEQRLDALRGEIRALQRDLEARATRDVPQVAYSIDGRTFEYEAPLSLPLPVGCYVLLETTDDRAYLGQIITTAVVRREGAELGITLDADQQELFPAGMSLSGVTDHLRVPALEGRGVLLGRASDDGFERTSATDVFQRAAVSRADASAVSRYLSGSGESARLPVGQTRYVDGGATVQLDASGFNRHTFLCGQSGSGKTFSLGIVLEQLLLETDLRILVIDPNSDFVELDRVRPREEVNQFRSEPLAAGAYEELVERYRDATDRLRIFRPRAVAGEGDEVLRLRFGDLTRREQSRVLDLDPLADREEFNAFRHILDRLGEREYSWQEVRNAVGRDLTAEARQLGLRIENLGVADWELWCPPGESSLADTLSSPDWRGLVLDVGTLGSPAEKSVVTNAVLTQLWRSRNQRRPTLVVVDEAHNVCPQAPADALQSLTTDAVDRIAAEGRKFGLYLLLSTQRPGKIRENVLSQCDNLLLMRMNSSGDLDRLQRTFSYVPASLLEEAAKFGLGEAILGGRIVQNPTVAKFEGRLTVEGGSDVPSTWAARRE